MIVESPIGQFSPFVVHYAETFIIPAAIKEYTIKPYGSLKEWNVEQLKLL